MSKLFRISNMCLELQRTFCSNLYLDLNAYENYCENRVVYLLHFSYGSYLNVFLFRTHYTSLEVNNYKYRNSWEDASEEHQIIMVSSFIEDIALQVYIDELKKLLYSMFSCICCKKIVDIQLTNFPIK